MATILMFSFATLGACKRNNEEGSKVYCTITFVQENAENITKQVEKGQALTDIPTPNPKTGHNVIWSVVDFSQITEDITVEAVYTAKIYTIYLQSDVSFSGEKEVKVRYNEIPVLPTPINENKEFIKWVLEDGQDYELTNYTIDGDLTLIAKWGSAGWYGPF